jgi:hypothetical protein
MSGRRLQPNDPRDHDALELYLRELERRVDDLSTLVESLTDPTSVNDGLTVADLQAIRDALETGGVAELDLTNLAGLNVDPQTATFPRLSAHPDPYTTTYDTYVIIGPPDTIWQIDRSVNPPVAVQISTSPTNYVTTDTPQTILNAAKKTWQGLQTFTDATGAVVIQPDSAPVAGTELLSLKPTGGGTSLAYWDTEGDSVANSYAAGTTALSAGSKCEIIGGTLMVSGGVFTTFGNVCIGAYTGNAVHVAGNVDGANNSTVNAAAGRLQLSSNGPRFQTSAATAVGAARSWTTRMTIDPTTGDATFVNGIVAVAGTYSGLMTLSRAGQALLMTGNAAANTKMLEVAPGGSSVFSVDREGDTLIAGLLTAAVGAVITTGGITITAGGLTITAGGQTINDGQFTSQSQFCVRAHATVAQALVNNTLTAITFGGVSIDRGSWWSAGSPARLTCPTGGDGVYAIVGQVSFAANATGSRQAFIRTNGATIQSRSIQVSAGATYGSAVLTSVQPIILSATDYVELMVLQDSGGALNTDVTTTAYTRLGLVKLF